MSDADPETVTVSADGITVRKSVDTERFQTLAVVLEMASQRDQPARIQVVDEIPEAVPIEDVGFHPDYGSEFWSVDEGIVAFERDFEPGEAYTTVYGIRDYPGDDRSELLAADPRIDLVETDPGSLENVVDQGRTQAVREFLSGKADLPGLGDELAEAAAAASEATEAAEAVSEAAGAAAEEAAEAEAEPEVVEPEPAEAEPEAVEPEPTDPAETEPVEAAPPEPELEPAEAAAAEPEPEPPAPEPAETGSPADEVAEEPATAGRREVRVPLTGGVVRVLIKELREGDVDPEDRRMLRDALLGSEGHTDARIAHLQQRVSDLEAYADALEEFIDEEGTAEEIITDLEDTVAELGRDVRAVDDRMDGVGDDVDWLENRTDDIADIVATVSSRTEVLDDRLEDVEAEVEHVDERADDLGARLDRLSTDLDGVDERVSAVDGRVADLRDDVEVLRGDLRDDVEAVEQELKSEFEGVERDLRAQVEALERDLEDFGEFRERLSSVFGGGGPGAAGGDEGEE